MSRHESFVPGNSGPVIGRESLSIDVARRFVDISLPIAAIDLEMAPINQQVMRVGEQMRRESQIEDPLTDPYRQLGKRTT